MYRVILWGSERHKVDEGEGEENASRIMGRAGEERKNDDSE